jgi:hypothetical protein
MALAQKEMVEELRLQWKKLWQERLDDKVRAEGMATADYCDLFVDRGTVIHATRDFKALNFKEIVEQHQVINADRYIPPLPQVGGWNKFIKNNQLQRFFSFLNRKLTFEELPWEIIEED